MIRSGWGLALLVGVITGVALFLRLVDLTTLPAGLHGDEAIVGLEGQRVLRDGLIDPYSWSARGQPTAPFYLAALTVWIWDNTVFAVRISAVIFGTLAIPALFFVVRRSLGVPVALLSATFLAVMGWHIHFSRIAFPLPAWPLWVILTAAVLVRAIHTRSYGWWALAGAMSGAGIYVYNAHTLTLVILCAFAGLCLVLQIRERTGEMIRKGASFAGALLASLLPMLWFVLNNRERYFDSINRHSVRQTPEWQELDGSLAHARYIIEQYVGFWWRLSVSPSVDYVDASGITAVIPPVLLAVSLVGMVIALLVHRIPLVWFGAMIVVLMPFATVLTEQGEMRRTLVIAPFLAMFAAVGIVELIRITRARRSAVAGWLTVLVCAAIVGVGVTVALRNYFVEQPESPTHHWIFAEQFHDATVYMEQLPGDSYVYFMSDRWSIDYEPREFLAPDVSGEDRSEEFGRFSLNVDPDQGDPVFVLVGDYRPVLEDLQDEYPGGEVVTGSVDGRPSFIAYHLSE